LVKSKYMNSIELNGRSISGMTLGTVQLGMDYGISNASGKPSQQKAFQILDTAIDGGVNSFDTANVYGDSEDVLGSYFSSQDKMKDPFITTKFRIDPDQGTDRAGIERQIRGFVDHSLETLKLNKIPLYMLHYAKDMSQYGDIVSETLKKLKIEGLVERIGASVYKPAEVEDMLEYDIYEAVQLPMNVLDLGMLKSGVLEKLKKAGYIVFVRSIFLQGLFFMVPGQMPASLESAAGHLKKLHRLAEREGLSIAQLTLSFIRDIEGVTSLVLGAETPEQVAENIRLMESPELRDSLAAEVVRLSDEVSIDNIMKELHARWRRI
jgi:aryl-alcohol dehydrogenase-like predicted oxidoreductase